MTTNDTRTDTLLDNVDDGRITNAEVDDVAATGSRHEIEDLIEELQEHKADIDQQLAIHNSRVRGGTPDPRFSGSWFESAKRARAAKHNQVVMLQRALRARFMPADAWQVDVVPDETTVQAMLDRGREIRHLVALTDRKIMVVSRAQKAVR